MGWQLLNFIHACNCFCSILIIPLLCPRLACVSVHVNSTKPILVEHLLYFLLPSHTFPQFAFSRLLMRPKRGALGDDCNLLPFLSNSPWTLGDLNEPNGPCTICRLHSCFCTASLRINYDLFIFSLSRCFQMPQRQSQTARSFYGFFKWIQIFIFPNAVLLECILAKF